MHARERQGLIERAQNSVVRSHGTKSSSRKIWLLLFSSTIFHVFNQMRSCENSSSGHKMNSPPSFLPGLAQCRKNIVLRLGCHIITLAAGRKLGLCGQEREPTVPLSNAPVRRRPPPPRHVRLLISVSGIDTAAEGGLVTGSPITKACSWEPTLKDSVKSGRKEPMQLSFSFFFSKINKTGKAVKKKKKRSLLQDLFIINYCGTMRPHCERERAWCCGRVPRGEGLRPACTGPPAGAHRVPSCWPGPASLPPSPHTSAALHKARARTVRCLMCCEMQRRREQCAGMAVGSEESSAGEAKIFCLDKFCHFLVLCSTERR